MDCYGTLGGKLCYGTQVQILFMKFTKEYENNKFLQIALFSYNRGALPNQKQVGKEFIENNF